MNVGLLIRAEVAATKRHEFLQGIEAPGLGGSEESGSGGEIFEAIETPNEFLLIRWWEDRDGLDAYLSSEPFRALMGAIRVLGRLEVLCILAERPPGVEFSTARAPSMRG
jgi:quinol monooxygenase YgiN